jgi:hypothetical protein
MLISFYAQQTCTFFLLDSFETGVPLGQAIAGVSMTGDTRSPELVEHILTRIVSCWMDILPDAFMLWQPKEVL